MVFLRSTFVIFFLCASVVSGRALSSAEVRAVYARQSVDIPHAPSNLTAGLTSSNHVQLTWTDHSDIENGFVLERNENNTGFQYLDSLAADVTGYTDSTVLAGHAYMYRLYSFNAAGRSTGSDSVTLIPAQSLSLDNANQYLEDSSPRSDFAVGDGVSDLPFSWSCWIKPDFTNGTEVQILGVQSTGSPDNWGTRLWGRKPQLLLYDGNPSNLIHRRADYALPEGEWTHIVWTYDGSGVYSGINIYINGIQQTAWEAGGLIGSYTACDGLVSGNAFKIGKLNYYPYKGLIDEVVVFRNIELTPSEVEELYNDAGVWDALRHSRSSGIVGYYKLDGNGDDSSGNGYHLSGIHAPVYVSDVPQPSGG